MKRAGERRPEPTERRTVTKFKYPVDAFGSRTYMPLQQADAAFDEGLAFVSRLF
jgi:hypothetical protein